MGKGAPLSSHSRWAQTNSHDERSTPGHEIHLFAPDVVMAVQDVVEASRRGARLPAGSKCYRSHTA